MFKKKNIGGKKLPKPVLSKILKLQKFLDKYFMC